MKKTIKILNLIVFIFALSSVIVWFFQNKNVEKPVVKEIPKQTQDLIDENSPEQKPESESIFDYSAENNNDHIIFNINKLNFEITRQKDSYESKFIVKNGNKIIFSKKYPYSVLNIFKINFKENNLFLINFYSGGAHCCSTVIPYLIDGEKVIEGTDLDLGNIDIFNGDTFFIKNDRLFTSSVDDRFAYFEMDYADSGSMFFTTYFELTINPLEFVNRNELFINSYSKLYLSSQTDSKEKINKENCSKDEIGKYQVFASLVSRYTYGFLSGVSREKLKTELSNDWWCFPEKDINKTENDIYQALQENDKSEDFVNETIMEGYNKANER